MLCQYLVLDPENNDATIGMVSEAEIWIVRNEYDMYHTGIALIDSEVRERVSVQELIKVCESLIASFKKTSNNRVSGLTQMRDFVGDFNHLAELMNKLKVL